MSLHRTDRLIAALRNLYVAVFEKPGQKFNSPLRSTISPRDTFTPGEYQTGSSKFFRFPLILANSVGSTWVRDTFIGTNGDLINNRVSDSDQLWTVQSGIGEISSNQATFTDTGTQIATVTANAHGTVQASITSLDASSIDAGIVFRFSDTSNYWKAVWEPDTENFVITKIVAGVPTIVHTEAYAFVVGTAVTIKVWLDGNTIRVYLDNVLRTIRVDSFNNTATKHGIIQVGTSTQKRFDGFLITPSEQRVGEINILTDPSSLGASLVLWLESGFSLSGFAQGDGVTTWSDKSGLGNDLTQATAGSKPIYDPNDNVNGYPVVDFDGSADFLEHLTPNDVFDVSATADWSIVLFVTTVDITSIGTWIAIQTDSSNFIYIHRIVDEVGWRIEKTANTTRRQSTNSNVLGAVGNYLITITKQGDNDVSVRVNSVADATRVAQSSDSAPNVSGTTLLGRVKTADVILYTPDRIAEVIVVSRLLTAQEITDIETYLKWKYSH